MFFGFIFTLILSLATVCSPIQAEIPQQTASTETGSIPELTRLEQLLETMYEEKINKELLDSPELDAESVYEKSKAGGFSSLSKEQQWIFIYDDLSLAHHMLLELYTIALTDEARQQVNALTDAIEQQAQSALAVSSLDDYQHNGKTISERFPETLQNIVSTKEKCIAFMLHCFSKSTPGHHGCYYYSTIKNMNVLFNALKDQEQRKNNTRISSVNPLAPLGRSEKDRLTADEMSPEDVELLMNIKRHAWTESQQGLRILIILINTDNEALFAAIDSFNKLLAKITQQIIATLFYTEEAQEKLEILGAQIQEADQQIKDIFINLDEKTKIMLKEVFLTEVHQKPRTQLIVTKDIVVSMINSGFALLIAAATYGMHELFASTPVSFPVWH